MIHIEMSLQSELEEKLKELEEFLNDEETEKALNELREKLESVARLREMQQNKE